MGATPSGSVVLTPSLALLSKEAGPALGRGILKVVALCHPTA